ncbi:phenylacetaldoxime dehydratase family protein [Streptomyces sp. NPDC051907]|uniref:phenylacetaldoxime dehydratase family protein n=1 Tax=Streptomyces sp. NPDC051907 TaxID=3155284 RepID=UPI0034394B68
MSTDTLPRPNPRFTAHSTRSPAETDEFCFGQYGCQAPTAELAAEAALGLAPCFSGPDAPTALDRGSFVDPSGAHNTVWLAYWNDPRAHRRWKRSARVRAVWEDLPLQGPVGHWREECVMSRLPGADVAETAAHDYWAAARDRVAASATGPLEPALDGVTTEFGETRGRRVTVTVPRSVTLIRTVQDWSASAALRHTYLADGVAPARERGVEYLASTPDSGCIAARSLQEQSDDGSPLARSSTVAWFVSLDHLLAWGRSQGTQLEIYASFFQTIGKGDQPLDVAFWHEVSVLPAGSVTAEYVNCGPHTGFLSLPDDGPAPSADGGNATERV